MTDMSKKKLKPIVESIIYSKEGDQICAMFESRQNFAEDPTGFGKTEEEAKADLYVKAKDHVDKPYMVKLLLCIIIDDLPHELGVTWMRSVNPFTKEKIESFISTDGFEKNVKALIPEEYQDKELKTIYVICNK